MLVIEADGLVVGGGTLHRQMQWQVGMPAAGVVQHADVGSDHRIHAEFRRLIHGPLPAFPAGRLWKGVESHEHPPALAMGVLHALGGDFGVEIQARKVPGVGVVAEADVHRIGPVIHGGLQ